MRKKQDYEKVEESFVKGGQGVGFRVFPGPLEPGEYQDGESWQEKQEEGVLGAELVGYEHDGDGEDKALEHEEEWLGDR